MSCYLIIVYRKHYVFHRTYIIVPTEFIKLCSIRTLFRAFLIQMKPVWDAFLDLFSNFISFAQHAKTNKETLKEQRVKRDKEKKIFNSKKEFVRVHSFMTSHSWTSLIRIQTPPRFKFAQVFPRQCI